MAEAVRDMNKHSSNLMAQQLLLSLARAAGVAPVNSDTAAAWLQTWFDAHGGRAAVWPAASSMARAWRARPASRPPTGRAAALGLAAALDARVAGLAAGGGAGWHARPPADALQARPGRAHLKTGTLRDATALGGIVHIA